MRRSSGTRSTSPFKVDPGNALSCVAAALVASFLPSPAFAASDDVNDTVVVDEESAGGTAPSASLPSKGAASAPGGLTIEGLAYWRSGLKKVPFTALGEPTSSQPTPTGYVKFDSSDLEGDDYAPGMRVSLHATMLDQPIELSGFFVAPFRFEQTKLELSSGSINTDTIYDNAPGSDYPNTANSDNIYGLAIHHETKLFGAEANAVRPFGIPGLSVGARAIYFGETLSSTAMSTSGSATNPPPTGTAIGEPRDRATIRTDNRLVGLQLGLQHMFDVGDVMRIGGSIKGGLYNNFVDRNRTFASENRIDIRSFETTDHKNVFAQGVEINPRVEFKLAEGTYLTASGQFLWLNNVSTALPHYATVNASGDHDVRANDDVFFYGGSLGLTVLLDQSSPTSNSLAPFPPVTSSAPAVDPSELDERIAELEDTDGGEGQQQCVAFGLRLDQSHGLVLGRRRHEGCLHRRQRRIQKPHKLQRRRAVRARVERRLSALDWSRRYGLERRQPVHLHRRRGARAAPLGLVDPQQRARHGHARAHLDGDRQHHPQGRRRHHAGRGQHRHDRRKLRRAACRSVRPGR